MRRVYLIVMYQFVACMESRVTLICRILLSTQSSGIEEGFNSEFRILFCSFLTESRVHHANELEIECNEVAHSRMMIIKL